MARKKKGGNQRRGDDSDEDTTSQAASTVTEQTEDGDDGKMSRKEKRMQKLKGKKNQQVKDDSDDDAVKNALEGLIPDANANADASEDSDDAPVQQKKLNKKQLRRLKEKEEAEKAAKAALMADSSEEEEEEEEPEPEPEEEEEAPPPEPVKKLSNKQLKKLREKEAAEAAAKAAMFDDSSSEEENEVDDDLSQEVEEKLVIDNDSDDDQSSKKKKKKKDKKKAKDDGSDDDEKDKKKKKKKKDKKKSKEVDEESEDEEEKKRRKAEKKEKKKKKKESEENDTAEKDDNKEEGGDVEDSEEIFYGAPDDHAWTDKSHAHKESEEKAKEGPDKTLTHGPDGKKLSNKERKRILKAREAAERFAEYEAKASKASAEGAQFACSQTAVNSNDPQWQNSLDVNIPNFSISAAGKVLFKDASLTIAHGRRYGLVGPNGKGKSTMLKMIASNDLKLPPRIDFLYVEQEVEADNTSAVDAVLKADKKRWDLLEEEEALTKKVDTGSEDEATVARLQVIYDELQAMGAEASESKARRILFGLGFDVEMQSKPTKQFSGGWRMRVSLARALFIEPTLLMLDEPTNHLDLNAVIWLDKYLTTWKKTLLVVSHDQDFLNSVCDEILHIEDLKLASYKGNYDTFKKSEATKVKQLQKAWEKQEKRLRELKRQGQSRAKATETVKKTSKREPGARSQKKANDAIASGTAAAEKTELIARPREYMVQLEFADVPELSRPVIEVNRVHFRYSEKHPVIFKEVDFGIDMDSRICVVGANGSGKSTLLKLLTGEINPVTGELRRNPRLRMGIYNQHFVDRLPMGKTPVEHLRSRFEDLDYQSARNRLGKYGLEGHAHEVTMRDLSGGQKARVVFVELSLQRPHVLLLDEPTNNLDIETIDALIDAINQFNGGIIVVTHDQRLIESCNCNLWVVEKEGVTIWSEGFDDYKEHLLRQIDEDTEKIAVARQKKLQEAAAKRAEKLELLQAMLKKK